MRAIAADRYLTAREDGWRCKKCEDEIKRDTTCAICNAPYHEPGETADPLAAMRQARQAAN